MREQHVCIICSRPFYKYPNGVKGRRGAEIRPNFAKTCSKRCSKAFTRRNHRRQFIAGLGGSPKKQG